MNTPTLKPSAEWMLDNIAALFATGRLDAAIEQSGPLAALVQKLSDAGHMHQVDGRWIPRFDGTAPLREAVQSMRKSLEPQSPAPAPEPLPPAQRVMSGDAWCAKRAQTKALLDTAPDSIRPLLRSYFGT